jgi:cation diffusion facilitator family transporter
VGRLTTVAGEEKKTNESTVTVVLALCANIGVGILKLGAGLITGSAALMSEAAHSAGDSTTEVLLLVAQRRSTKPADRSHPFGYGKERYFWSLLAAVAIFVSGSAFAFYQGVHAILGEHGGGSSGELWINYPVLALAAVLEGISLRQAAGQMKRETRRTNRSLLGYLRTPRDPTINSVLLEDSAAMVGIALAAAGVGLHQLTGSAVWDGAASIAIGVLLLCVSVLLARACEGLLIGRQADPRLLHEVVKYLEDRDEVLDVVDVLTMVTGIDSVLLCLRVDFEDDLDAADLEESCVRLDEQLRQRLPMLSEVFIQPASRRDKALRERVETRYGRALADD